MTAGPAKPAARTGHSPRLIAAAPQSAVAHFPTRLAGAVAPGEAPADPLALVARALEPAHLGVRAAEDAR
jgi:hypothetical protein